MAIFPLLYVVKMSLRNIKMAPNIKMALQCCIVGDSFFPFLTKRCPFHLFFTFLLFSHLLRLFCVHVTNMLLSASLRSASSTYLRVHHKKVAKDEKRTKKVNERWKGHLFVKIVKKNLSPSIQHLLNCDKYSFNTFKRKCTQG